MRAELAKMNTHAHQTQGIKRLFTTNEGAQKLYDGESSFKFVDTRQQAVAQRELQEIANNSPQVRQLRPFQKMADDCRPSKNETFRKRGSAGGAPVQCLRLQLPTPSDEPSEWVVDTTGPGSDMLKAWVDAQAERGGAGRLAIESLIQQLQQIEKPDSFESYILNYALLAAKVESGEGAAAAMTLVFKYGNVEAGTTKSFAARAESMAPQWRDIKPHGDEPLEGHMFVFRFTTVGERRWALSHLGRTASDLGIDVDTPIPAIPKGKESPEARKNRIAKIKAIKALQDVVKLDRPGAMAGEAKDVLRQRPAKLKEFTPLVKSRGESYEKLAIDFRQQFDLHNHTFDPVPEADTIQLQEELQRRMDKEKREGSVDSGLFQSLKKLYSLSAAVFREEGELVTARENFAFWNNMPDSDQELVRAYLVRYEKLKLAREHFSGDKAKLAVSPFASTAAHYMPIVLHKDKVMQAIVRSEENLESTPEYNKEKEGRALEYQRAPDLVKYEVPMNLLFTPEEVEKAFGMGSSDVEGLVAMRQIKERLFLGENLDDYIVAVAENPF